MSEYYGVIRSANSLQHHGIKGQKWGVRRFQNPDGTLTAAGKKRADKLKARTMAVIEDGASKYKTANKKLDAAMADCLTGEQMMDDLNRPYPNRSTKAAELGLKALEKHDPKLLTPLYTDDRSIEDLEKHGRRRYQKDSDNYEWFLLEDQTPGMPEIADMIERGYSAKQCSKMIDIVEANYRLNDASISNKHHYGAAFTISVGNYNDSLKQFAKTCEQIKRSKNE